ncbi:DUF2842 domain-containing protein [Methyloligella sp. 2.7D]|uniref:DUF2842 domain-containing protein n=1 Tax=unclassified Methyloligella TaxID=2625955 RepID=UPI00157C5449|nr:DUF2842 domain-containing protein [Methyloligella sp. GL2]QKP77579.1 DUF2842 domain-containing protein [Methyloligella sp. GL2]
MGIRVRKLIGTVAILAFVLTYVLIVAAIGSGHIAEAGLWARFFFFLIAGLIWVIPAALIIRWMQKPDPLPGSK